MIDNETCKLFLPKFLSAETEDEFYEDINKFPQRYDNFYTTYLPEPNVLFQGDCIADLPIYKFSKHGVCLWRNSECILLSNSCDMNLKNKRMYPTNIVYAPLVKLSMFRSKVLLQKYPEERVDTLVKSIKAQKCSQILYLPECGNREESLVFLDRLFHIPNREVNRENLEASRTSTLNFWGNYLVVLKISMHFLRMKDSLGKWE